MTAEEWTFETVAEAFVRKAAAYTAGRYRAYGVEFDDVSQEILAWLYGQGEAKVRRWLRSRPQQTTRVYRSMLDVALGYAEREKAQKVGYDIDDVAWYTPATVEGLMPLVLDDTFTGILERENEPGVRSGKPLSEGGDLMAMVLDIRRALKQCKLTDYFLLHDLGDDRWAEHVETVVDFLGGRRPHVGRRRVMSNAQCQSITTEQEAA